MFRLPTIADLDYVLHAAIAVDNAVGGCIQLVTDQGRSLRIAVAAGLGDEYFAQFATVSTGMATSCAQALMERRRIVIRDVETDAAFAQNAAGAVAVGYRSVQSTPLIDGEFRMIGVLTTHFAAPHHPGPDSLAAIDRYARVAALIVEVDELHAAIVDADRRLSIPARALPAPVADAASSVRRVLPLLAQPNHDATLRTAVAHLDAIAQHLRATLSQARGFSALASRTLLTPG